MKTLWSNRIEKERIEQLRMLKDLTESKSIDQLFKVLISSYYEYQSLRDRLDRECITNAPVSMPSSTLHYMGKADRDGTDSKPKKNK